METGVDIEIHFFSQTEVAVDIANTVEESLKDGIEILAFCLHTFRMMVNLGVDHITTQDLAAKLACIDGDFDSFRRFGQGDPSVPKLVDRNGRIGSKRFKQQLRLSGQEISGITGQSEGFGMLAMGVGYYAPASVLALLSHLAQEHSEDETFLLSLCAVARVSGKFALEGKLTMQNQGQLAMYIYQELA